MMTIKQVADKRIYYLERFTRFDYEQAFEELKGELTELLDGKNEHGMRALVSELMEYVSKCSSGFLKRNRELDIFRRFFSLYVVPASFASGDESFGIILNEEWNKAYPKNKFEIGNYQEIASWFRTMPFGMG